MSTLTRLYVSRETRAGSGHTLAGALLGFFVITLDAVIVIIALPSIRHDFGGGITGLQWVVDGYTLMFAALLLSAGAPTDRVGGRRDDAVLDVPDSPGVPGTGRTGPRDRRLGHGRRRRVVLRSRPRGLLRLASWRLIFFVTIPVGTVALLLLARTERSPDRRVPLGSVPFDWAGQSTAVLAMGGLTGQFTAVPLTGAPVRYVRITLTAASDSWFSVADVRAHTAGQGR